MAAKLAAGRAKDFEFVAALLRTGIIDAATASGRVAQLPIGRGPRNRLIAWIEGAGL